MSSVQGALNAARAQLVALGAKRDDDPPARQTRRRLLEERIADYEAQVADEMRLPHRSDTDD